MLCDNGLTVLISHLLVLVMAAGGLPVSLMGERADRLAFEMSRYGAMNDSQTFSRIHFLCYGAE